MKTAVLAVMSMFAMGYVVMADEVHEKALCDAVFDFGKRLQPKMTPDKRTVVFSPAVLHALLTMMLPGARNETAEELNRVLNISSIPEAILHYSYRSVIKMLKSIPQMKYEGPKAILIHPNSTIQTQFKDHIVKTYSKKVLNFNLTTPRESEKEINKYFEERTQGLIKDILEKDSVNNEQSIILISAFIINGTWHNQFDPRKTQQRDFFRLDGTVSKVDMMDDTRTVLLKRDNDSGVDVVALPLEGGRVSLTIALPQRKDGIDDLQNRVLQSENASKLFEDLDPSYVRLTIPRFRIESDLSLEGSLKELGMVKAFTPGVADFRGISKTGDLYISKIQQRAIVNVQEAGLVTTKESVKAVTSSLDWSTKTSDEFIADHPFMFFIRDSETGVVLLQGVFAG